MTSHLVETVRDIPLTSDKQIPADDESSGFPFDDRDFDRDRSHSSFRSQLDDIARRHPEFAEHLNISGGFPFRSHTLGRHPRRGSDAEKPSGSQDAEFRRYPHDRPFARFDNFDFPFHKYFDEDVPDFYEAGYRAPTERQPQYTYTSRQQPAEEAEFQQQPQQYQQQQSQPGSPQPTSFANAEKPPQAPQTREGARKQNIQQSNTVDLGQKQEPVDENRGQRSMSAPPENRSTGQRFVSSINIPIQRPSGGGDMGSKSSTQAQEPPQQQPQCNKPNERVIPIHVEGRDEPIVPKNINTTFTQPPPQPQPQPQPERVFGRNPSHFTQYLNRGEPHGMNPEEYYRQQQQQFQKQQPQNFKQQNQNVSQEPQDQSQQQSESEPQQQAQTQPTPSSHKSTQLDQIQSIQKDVNELMNQVEKFNGKPKDKEYLYLDEMLTRNLIKLDNIETEGKDNIRQARKEAIKCIEGCIGILEAKANANLAAESQKEEEKMEVVQAGETEKLQEEPQVLASSAEKPIEPSDSSATNEQTVAEKSPPAVLEVSGVVRTGSVANVTPMEVTTTDESNKDLPVPAPIETQNPEKKDVTLSTDVQQKSEDQNITNITKEEIKNEKKEDEEKEDTKIKAEVKKDNDVNQESAKPAEAIDTTTTETITPNPSQESSTTPEDKKEKKKGKKKEKIDKK
ncbi:hypothetical protein Trydic_g3256 [Trypoxylus dichotomus]